MPAYDHESSTSPIFPAKGSPGSSQDKQIKGVSVEELFHKGIGASSSPPHISPWNSPEEYKSAFPLTLDAGSGFVEPLAINMAWKDESDPEWTRIRTVMDSGAAESVGPPSMAPEVPIRESPGSRMNRAYVAAGGERIPNMGQKVLTVVTNEGREAKAVYQVAEVTRPLTAVGSTCDRGNVVVYGPHGGCIINRETGLQTDFERRGGIYELDLWIQTASSGEEYQRDFPRLGR